MIRFLLHELAGWLLVGLGLYIFIVCMSTLLLPEPGLCEASSLSVIGIVVFRGGIHLLKVAVAARVSLDAKRKIDEQQAQKSGKKSDTPWDW